MSSPSSPAMRSAGPGGLATRGPQFLLVAVVLIAAVQWALVLLFGWPTANTAPHDLPLAISGPPAATSAVTAAIDHAQPDAFSWTTVADDAAARDAVLDRDSYAALVFGRDGTTLYTASAASPAVASALATQVPAAVAAANPAASVTVTDLAPNPAGDPHGNALGITLIPIMITSVAAGVLVALLTPKSGRRIAALLGYAVVAGALSTFALQTMLSVLAGSWWANAGVAALACLAVAAATTGLTAVAGIPGAITSVLVLFFVAVPLSGSMSAWQLLPTPWGAIGQLLPAGAAATATRAVAFFDGAGAGKALLALAFWAVLGLALAAFFDGPHRRAATAAPTEAQESYA